MALNPPIIYKGLVIKSTGSWYHLLDDSGQAFLARLPGRFKLNERQATNPLAVGDKVLFKIEPQDGKDTAIITQICQRHNYIARQSVHNAHQAHIIAANLDQAILMATLVKPRTSSGFIDRFLVSTESFRIPTILVFNKSDLLGPKENLRQSQLIEIYERIGYLCIAASVYTKQGIEQIEALLDGKITLISGHSGVGKSSLLNLLNPVLNLPVNQISNSVSKGVHTTTFAQMHQSRPGSFIIDTPGIREFGISNTSNAELGHYFPEIRNLIGACRYHNCSHQHEPGCAIIEAVNSGQIDPGRYQNYLNILNGVDSRR